MSKWADRSLVLDHYRTFRDATTNEPLLRDYLEFLVLPVVVGSAALIFDFRLANASGLLAGVSVFAGFLFGLLFAVLELRLRVTNDPRVPAGSRLVHLLDELSANATYAAMVGLLVVGVLAGAAATMNGHLHVNIYVSAALIALFVHMLMTVAMVIKRTRIAYKELARRPTPRPTSDPQEVETPR